MAAPLTDFLAIGADVTGDDVLVAMTEWADARGLVLYEHQEEAILELLAGNNVILATPTGSGKSLVALAAHALAVAHRDVPGQRSWYTAPVKALVSEKFFELCRELGAENVGLLTGDSAVNADAPVICCTTEILAHVALKDGATADAGSVVLDEFHFYGDPDRGWAWQVPLLELPQSAFLLLSATLGDTTFFADELTRRTGRDTAVVDGVVRPVPLHFEYRRTPLHHTIEELVERGAGPLYLVNFSQRDAVTMATAMASVVKLGPEAKELVAAELADARLRSGFGKDLGRLLRNGVGVHHAGMLPRYRRIVERLTQQGALTVISGTDTLGIGVNLPIRTVVLTRLYKYDGVETRLLTAREFHQIAGRAGRAGYDTEGLVVALAPAHVAENDAAEAKAAADPKKKRKLKKASPPKGFVHYDEDTFDRLQAATPERLHSSFTMTPGMLLQLLDRPGDAWVHAKALLLGNHEPRNRQRRHVRRTLSLFRALEAGGIVSRRDEPDAYGRFVEVDQSLQDDFALDQLLSPFLVATLPDLDRDDPGYPFVVLALVEAVVDNPFPVLRAMRDAARDEAMSQMKAAGVPYEERIEKLDTIDYPQPLRQEIYATFDSWRGANPWIGSRNIAPKGVVRDLWERAMDFPSFVRHYGLKRSEGVVLRYFSDVYKTLARAVPNDARTPEVDELIDWLGAVIRATDSSLLDEWLALQAGTGTGTAATSDTATGTDEGDNATPPITADTRGFRALVRNRLFRWVQYAATGRWEAWSEELTELGDFGWTATSLRAAFDGYAAAYPVDGISASDSGDAPAGTEAPGSGLDIATDADARGPGRFLVDERGREWAVEQILSDPDGDHEWYVAATVDLAASDDAGDVVVRLGGVHQR